MKKRSYAIMGATGQTGMVLAHELLKKGQRVRVLGRDATKLAALKKMGAEIATPSADSATELTQAFSGMDAVFVMLPPDYTTSDMGARQDKVSEAICTALANIKIKNVVNLSSIGAQHSKGVGPISGLHRHEKRLNQINGINVLHLRASYFMQNYNWSMETIQRDGIVVSSIHRDVPIPMISTHDVALKAAKYLASLDFKGSTVVECGGPEGLTMDQAAKILSKVYGKPIKYVQASYDDAEKGMTAHGMPASVAKMMVEMHKALNDGKLAPMQEITRENKGVTKLEDFAKQLFHTRQQAA